MQKLQLTVPFASSQQLFKLTSDLGGEVISQDFKSAGILGLVSIPESSVESFMEQLQNLCKGQATFIE
jgi:putative IMPACT (imprinted ancient) family translation regulator